MIKWLAPKIIKENISWPLVWKMAHLGNDHTILTSEKIKTDLILFLLLSLLLLFSILLFFLLPLTFSILVFIPLFTLFFSRLSFLPLLSSTSILHTCSISLFLSPSCWSMTEREEMLPLVTEYTYRQCRGGGGGGGKRRRRRRRRRRRWWGDWHLLHVEQMWESEDRKQRGRVVCSSTGSH